MKKICLMLPMLLISCQCMALTTIYDGTTEGKKSIFADQYLRFNSNQNAPKEVANDNSDQMSGLPVTSALQAGEFKSYSLSDCQKYPASFFVIGADESSIEWLKAHKRHLQDVHAVGLITNIDSEKELQNIERFSPIHLIPANVDALAEVIKASAYPFLTNGCEVWQ